MPNIKLYCMIIFKLFANIAAAAADSIQKKKFTIRQLSFKLNVIIRFKSLFTTISHLKLD